MKLKDTFVSHVTNGEQILVDAMFEKYDAPKEVLRRDAQAVIDKLRSVGAIDEQHNI